MRKALGVIPVRWGSTRFPGKPLAVISGKTMIERVWDRARRATGIERLVIATDDDRIFAAASSFGAEVRMTRPDHASGTDRAAEVATGSVSPIVLNIQGDEPLIEASDLDRLVDALQDSSIAAATLMAKVSDLDMIGDTHRVKVVADADGNALYFSRSPLPWGAQDHFFQHVGIYGYQRDFLLNFGAIPVSRLERAERLEQLRILESGRRIKMIEIARPTLSVDHPGDIIEVERFLEERAHG